VTLTVRATILVPAGSPVDVVTGAVTTNPDPVPSNSRASVSFVA
jgi:hypothetical protein